MSAIVDLYLPGKSWLHRVDPRVKLLFVACMIILLIVLQNVWVMGVALVLLHLLHLSAETPLSRLRFLWQTLLPIALLMLILRVTFYPQGAPWFAIWIIKVTPIAVAQGLVLALRILTMALAVFAWLYTTSQPDLIQGLVKLGIPHEWGMVLALALRYIPTFQGMFGRISQAQQARGLNLKQHKGIQRVRVMMPIFVAMIISSLRTSSQLAMSLEARGYGQTDVRRSTLHEIHFKRSDYALTALLLALLGVVIYLNIRYGFGRDPVELFQSAEYVS